ncbi:MAG TPA: hypothetical protein VHZ24_00345 [Pirellulales bacterium]|jgi:hypothetical protein|nr:hypothetical protein [Pirellulales bacterium]
MRAIFLSAIVGALVGLLVGTCIDTLGTPGTYPYSTFTSPDWFNGGLATNTVPHWPGYAMGTLLGGCFASLATYVRRNWDW